MGGMHLPGGMHLAYVDCRHAWYYRIPGVVDVPGIAISASADVGGGGAWGFAVEEVDAGGPALRLRIFHDAFAAFAQIPGFFAALAAGARTLDDVVAILRDLGAADETPRQRPSR